MDTATLHAFLTVADSGSFSQAAEALFVTQPAVSKRVAALESELGMRLFDRIGRKVTLTEAGRILLPRARQVMIELDDSKRAVANLSGLVAGRLRVGTSHHIALHRMPPVLRAYVRDYPEVELDLRFMDSEQVSNAVQNGDLELGVITLPVAPDPALVVIPVWPDPMSVVVSSSHELAQIPRIRVADLAQQGAILAPRGTYTRDLLESGFEKLGLSPKIRLESHYLETIKMLVQVGLAWSVLPDSMIDKRQCQVLTVPGLKIMRHLGVVHHRDRTLSNAAHAMMDTLRDLNQSEAT